MKSAQFIKTVAKAYRVNEKSLVHSARLLKEAGLLTTGPRGVNAPDMTPLDAARLTIALLATDKPTKVVEAVQKFGNLTASRKYGKDRVPIPAELEQAEVGGTTYENALAEIFSLEDHSWGEVTGIEISVEDEQAIIRCPDHPIIFDGSAEEVKGVWESDQNRGICTARRIDFAGIMDVALPLKHGEYYAYDF